MEDKNTDSVICSSASRKRKLGLGIGVPIDNYEIPFMSSSTTFNTVHDTNSRVTLAWKDISVNVPVKKMGFQKLKKQCYFKNVLSNVSGIIYPGSLTAVMGASGTGKTTLMNVLTHKTKSDIEICGKVLVNGISVGPFIKNISGYVYQEDLFIGTMTVAEHLHFMANMKFDQRIKYSEKIRRVEELLTDLSLKKCENTKIGIPGQITGISGGEKKRLAFATEILTNPSLLFFDEPTTGLDSFSAKKIVGMLKNMASQGKTILCTIHQPSSQVFSMFDQFYFLAEGCTAFMGSSERALNMMNKLNHHCPLHYNLGDFYIRTLSIIPGQEIESRLNIHRICDAFSKSKEAKEIDEKIQIEIKRCCVNGSGFSVKTMDTNFGFPQEQILRPNWFSLTGWLLWRAMINIIRNPKLQAIKLGQKIILAFLIGACYFQISINEEGIQNIQGVIFLIITENTFPSLYGALYTFPLQFSIFLREEKGGLYRVSSYYLANIISIVPSLILEGLIFTTITYYLVGLQPNFEMYLLTCLIVILTVSVGSALGCFLSALFDTVTMAILFLIPFDYILLVTGGQYINLESLPFYIVWTKYISSVMYSVEAISIIQWKNVSNISCDTSLEVNCITNGEQVLKSRNFQENHLIFDIFGLIILYIFFHICGYLSLVAKTRKK